jgi:ribokinase
MRVGADNAQMERVRLALADASALVLQLETPVETVASLIVTGHQMGVPVVLNLAPAHVLSLEILRQLAVLIVNETEACFLFDALNEKQQAPATINNVTEAALMAFNLHSRGIARVVITLGGQGAILAYEGKSIHVAPPSVQVVDTTAAGDCFAGAFTVALTEGQDMAQTLRFAVCASALKVTKFGAQSGLPTRAEVEALVRSLNV